MTPNFIGVSGLPRAGSTLMCQLLAQHPDVHSEGNSSPVCSALQNMRRTISDDPFFLSQLDTAFDASYAHLKTAMQGFLRGWYQDCGKLAVVDKNRAWLHAVEMLLQLAPEAKLIVCVRELGQVYGSVEAQHQRTILLDFIDHLAVISVSLGLAGCNVAPVKRDTYNAITDAVKGAAATTTVPRPRIIPLLISKTMAHLLLLMAVPSTCR